MLSVCAYGVCECVYVCSSCLCELLDEQTRPTVLLLVWRDLTLSCMLFKTAQLDDLLGEQKKKDDKKVRVSMSMTQLFLPVFCAC